MFNYKRILFSFNSTLSLAGKPNIPKGINQDTFCDKEREKYGHVIILLDLKLKLYVVERMRHLHLDSKILEH